jgi:23S rRNA (adenine1618-N6)-methyltransferase
LILSNTASFHPRNKHQGRYDFEKLVQQHPPLKAYLKTTSDKKKSDVATIDFSDANAVKALNQALLMTQYQISFWDIPDGYLCPPIPSRADYIHRVADLIAVNGSPTSKLVQALDIGMGANCIFPLLGHRAYGWKFVGADIDSTAVRTAKGLVQANDLAKAIKCRLQLHAEHIFHDIIKDTEIFDLVVCNPPFHSSEEKAKTASKRKWKNLGKNPNTGFNFKGKSSELAYPGGERAFVSKMIEESQDYKEQVLWFTSLISNKKHLDNLQKQIEYFKARFKVLEMQHGQKQSRILAWTYANESKELNWKKQIFKG